MTDKRTALELMSAKETMTDIGMKCKWVNSERQLADGLTKPGASNMLKLAMRTGKWKIVFDETYTSAKKLKKARRATYFATRNQERADENEAADMAMTVHKTKRTKIWKRCTEQ